MTDRILPDMEFARRLFERLDKHWGGKKRGMIRPGYGENETAAIEMMAEAALNLGMKWYQDLAGNAYFVMNGQDPSLPVFMSGSHLDAVPRGGRFDGPAGVVGALTAAKSMRDNHITPAQDYVVVIWRCEESPAYGQFAVGSQLAVGGKLTPEILTRKFNANKKLTLADCMGKAGLDITRLEAAIRTGNPVTPLERIGYAVELHIEQENYLSTLLPEGRPDEEYPLGLVKAFRGNFRFPKGILFQGKAGHSGSTRIRHDAAEAASRFVTLACDEFEKLSLQDYDIVWTTPNLRVLKPASTTIPANCIAQHEIRTTDNAVLENAEDIYRRAICGATGKTRTIVDWERTKFSITKPAIMDQGLTSAIHEAAHQTGIRTQATYSGAGHDLGNLPETIRRAMIFIPHGQDNGGISHDPGETMSITKHGDPFVRNGGFDRAVTLLTQVVLETHDLQPSRGHDFGSALLALGAQRIAAGW